MYASDVTFAQMRRSARNLSSLGIPCSYMQVEYGLDELEACWDGFVHTSDYANLIFKTRKQVCVSFANILSEYLEYLGESIFVEVGS